MTIMAKIAIASIVGVGSIFTGIAAKAGWKFWQRNRQTIPISGRCALLENTTAFIFLFCVLSGIKI